MDDGPWTALGGFGWFLGVWVVMMARDDVPVGRADGRAVLAHDRSSARRCRRCCSPPATCSTWARRGRARATRSRRLGGAIAGDVLAWDRAGRWVAGGDAARRRRLRADAAQGRLPRQVPQPARLPARRRGATGRAGALQMGAKHGAWCVGCCWALMASLFALGVMSVVWMAVVAGLIAVEKTLPWRRVRDLRDGGGPARARRALLAAPDAVPALDDPRRGIDGPDDGLAARP